MELLLQRICEILSAPILLSLFNPVFLWPEWSLYLSTLVFDIQMKNDAVRNGVCQKPCLHIFWTILFQGD